MCRNGYQKFSQEMLSNGELNHLPMKERMTEIGSRWQRLPLKDKDRYKKIAEEKQRQYKVQLEQWLAVRSGFDRGRWLRAGPLPSVTCSCSPAEPVVTREEHLQRVQLAGQSHTLHLGMTLKSHHDTLREKKNLRLAFQKRKSAAKPGGPKAKSKKSVSTDAALQVRREEEVNQPETSPPTGHGGGGRGGRRRRR